MKIRRKDSEDTEELEELLAHALTEDIAKWLEGFWLDYPVPLQTKTDIYNVVLKTFKKGVEI